MRLTGSFLAESTKTVRTAECRPEWSNADRSSISFSCCNTVSDQSGQWQSGRYRPALTLIGSITGSHMVKSSDRMLQMR